MFRADTYDVHNDVWFSAKLLFSAASWGQNVTFHEMIMMSALY